MNYDSIRDLQAAVAAFVDARDWAKLHTPKNLAMSIAVEAAEIMELFQWTRTDAEALESLRNKILKEDLSLELADVIIYCLSLSYRSGIDLGEAVRRKIQLNETRFPIGQK